MMSVDNFSASTNVAEKEKILAQVEYIACTDQMDKCKISIMIHINVQCAIIKKYCKAACIAFPLTINYTLWSTEVQQCEPCGPFPIAKPIGEQKIVTFYAVTIAQTLSGYHQELMSS